MEFKQVGIVNPESHSGWTTCKYCLRSPKFFSIAGPPDRPIIELTFHESARGLERADQINLCLNNKSITHCDSITYLFILASYWKQTFLYIFTMFIKFVTRCNMFYIACLIRLIVPLVLFLVHGLIWPWLSKWFRRWPFKAVKPESDFNEQSSLGRQVCPARYASLVTINNCCAAHWLHPGRSRPLVQSTVLSTARLSV